MILHLLPPQQERNKRIKEKRLIHDWMSYPRKTLGSSQRAQCGLSVDVKAHNNYTNSKRAKTERLAVWHPHRSSITAK